MTYLLIPKFVDVEVNGVFGYLFVTSKSYKQIKLTHTISACTNF